MFILLKKIRKLFLDFRNRIIKKKFGSVGIGLVMNLGKSYMFHDAKKINIGDYVYIGENPYWSASGGITIGSNISFGPKTKIHTMNHRYENATSIPYDGCSYIQPVIIEDNCWIGAHVLILPGVRIGEGSIVGAGSVVTKDVPKYTVVGGNPAKTIANRDLKRYMFLKDNNLLWHKMSKENRTKYFFINKENNNKVKIEDVLIQFDDIKLFKGYSK